MQFLFLLHEWMWRSGSDLHSFKKLLTVWTDFLIYVGKLTTIGDCWTTVNYVRLLYYADGYDSEKHYAIAVHPLILVCWPKNVSMSAEKQMNQGCKISLNGAKSLSSVNKHYNHKCETIHSTNSLLLSVHFPLAAPLLRKYHLSCS